MKGLEIIRPRCLKMDHIIIWSMVGRNKNNIYNSLAIYPNAHKYSTMMTIQQFKQTKAGAFVDLPFAIIEEVLILSAKHRVDLNTVQKKNDAYIIGEPRTGLTIKANKNRAAFNDI